MTFFESLARKLDRTGVDPVVWHAPPPPQTGVLAPNGMLDDAHRWTLPTGEGPEDVAVDHDGRVVTGGNDGRIWRFDSRGHATELANTHGRPLGVEILDDGRFLICEIGRASCRERVL